MAEYIPFVFTDNDCRIVSSTYQDAKLVRVPVVKAAKFTTLLPKDTKLWVDPLFDGFHDGPGNKWDWWDSHVKGCPDYRELWNPSFVAKPDKAKVKAIVDYFLDGCLTFKPSAITVPQLPVVKDVTRNKLNWELANCCGDWRERVKFEGQLVLPIIFTNQDQINTARRKRIAAIEKSYSNSNANAYWIVDSSLPDQSGSPTFLKKRFPALIDFHTEINEAIPTCVTRIGGPYWGMNLVLWARNLVDSPAISIGRSFRYFLSGGRGNQPKVRIAIPSLRRWVQTSAAFVDWLAECENLLGEDTAAYKELANLSKKYSRLQTQDASRRQIAEFYKKWIDEIASTDTAGRALALYQDLSSAYVLGKTLPDLPSDERTARRPERVAEYLMLSCL